MYELVIKRILFFLNVADNFFCQGKYRVFAWLFKEIFTEKYRTKPMRYNSQI